MRVIAFDTETDLIRPGRLAPPMTCMTWQEAVDFNPADDAHTLTEPQICLHTDAYPLLRAWLLDPEVVLVGHNVAFDMGVICAEWPDLIPLVFAAYEADRITDTMLREKLLDIADGRYRGFYDEETSKWIKLAYSLADCVRRHTGQPFKKEGFRMFYAPFRGVPLEQWTDFASDLQYRAGYWLGGAPDADLDDLCASFGDAEKFRKEVAGMIAARPEEAKSYPLDDASGTMSVFLPQEVHASEYLADQWRQARTAWCKHLTSAHGLRTAAPRVASLQLMTERSCKELEEELVRSGLVRSDGTRDTKLAKQKMLEACGWQWDAGAGKYEPIRCTKHDDCREHPQIGLACGEESALPLRLTDSGEPSLDSDACKATGNALMKKYAGLTSLKTVLNKDVPALAKAVIYPIHTRFDLAETGRTTSSNPNVMNWRKLPGIRECFTPRPGRVYVQADYSTLELCALAQVCLDLFGHSKLAEMLNAGIDPHSLFASVVLGWLYEETHRAAKDKGHVKHKEAENARNVGKAFNFGAPGGLGMKRKRNGDEATLIVFARKTYGIEISHEDLLDYAKTWHETFPEMLEYFAYVTSLKGQDGSITLRQVRSNRVRGGALFTSACNSFFQGLGADATAGAYWLIAKACYVDTTSPLFGSRIVNYVHDEWIIESPEECAAECAEELSRLMVLGASVWMPDIKLAAEPCLMRVWSKDAKTLRDASGRLVVWEPEVEAVAA